MKHLTETERAISEAAIRAYKASQDFIHPPMENRPFEMRLRKQFRITRENARSALTAKGE